MPQQSLFIGYRRYDVPDAASRIYDRLVGSFGREHVFKDVDDIPVGIDFSRHLREVLSQCRVCIILIGPRWIDTLDGSGRRRLDDPQDWVRKEIEIAFELDLQVIPVLINGSSMPDAESLPASIQKLVTLNAAQVRGDPDFHNDMDSLVCALRQGALAGVVVVPPLPRLEDASSEDSHKRWEAYEFRLGNLALEQTRLERQGLLSAEHIARLRSETAKVEDDVAKDVGLAPFHRQLLYEGIESNYRSLRSREQEPDSLEAEATSLSDSLEHIPEGEAHGSGISSIEDTKDSEDRYQFRIEKHDLQRDRLGRVAGSYPESGISELRAELASIEGDVSNDEVLASEQRVSLLSSVENRYRQLDYFEASMRQKFLPAEDKQSTHTSEAVGPASREAPAQLPVGCGLAFIVTALVVPAFTVAQHSAFRNWLLYAATVLVVIWTYFFPFIVSKRSAKVFVLNSLFGWTIIGWFLLLPTEHPARRNFVVVLIFLALGLVVLAATLTQQSFLRDWLLYAAAAIAGGLAAVWIYFLPYLNSNRSTTMLVLNVLFGWTVVGWVILMMHETHAQRSDRIYREMYPPSGIPPNPIFERELKKHNHHRQHRPYR